VNDVSKKWGRTLMLKCPAPADHPFSSR
jgi:hypothetical protein